MGQKQTDIDLYKDPFPHLSTSPEMNTAFLSSQPDSPSEASEGPPTSDVPLQSDMVISAVAAQATTAFLVNEMTDQLLRSSADLLARDYDLLLQATCILMNHRIKRSQISELLKAVIRRKDIVWDHCEGLKKERAALRKGFRKAFPGKPVVKGVRVYTNQTGRSHPVNGRLFEQLYGTPPPQVTKSTKGSAAKKIELLFDEAEEGYEMDIEDTKGDDDDTSDDEDEDYEENGEEDEEEEVEENEQDEVGEEEDSDDDEEMEEDMD